MNVLEQITLLKVGLVTVITNKHVFFLTCVMVAHRASIGKKLSLIFMSVDFVSAHAEKMIDDKKVSASVKSELKDVLAQVYFVLGYHLTFIHESE